MKKKKINKLIVPLTIRSASILSAFTIMATSIVGCASKKETKDDKSDPTPGIYDDINDDLKNNSDIIFPSPSEESQIEEKENESSINNEVNNNYNNTTTKPNNTSKPTPGNNSNKNNSTNNNTSSSTPTPGDDGNKSDDKTLEDEDKFIPLTPNNINDIPTFERAVMEVSRETRGGFGGIWGYYYEGEIYRSYGLPFDELKYVLVAFNKDYLSDDMLNSLLGSYSKDELKRYYYILGPMIGFVEHAQCENNWDGLIIDPQTLNEFKAIEKAFLDYRFNNNPEPLKKILYNYNVNTSNPLVGYYIYQACDYATRNSSIKADEDVVDKYIGLITNVKSECVSLAENIYSRSHGKKKILE